MIAARRWVLVATAWASAGCATFPANPPLAPSTTPAAGYRFENLAPEGPGEDADRTFLVMTASGGGTRAAAFAYGAMQAMQETAIAPGRSVLDELDMISSVSGGSFAAAYYGLFRERFFTDFKDDVLYRPMQGDLLVRLLAPWNLARVASPSFSRSDLADEYYGDEIFAGRTYRDLPRRRPWIVLNATDLSSGSQFSFVQDQFDLLCSDLDGVRVSRAVTASSAFPLAFPPLTLRNYPKGQCGYQRPIWVDQAASDFEAAPARWALARSHREYEDASDRPWLHLADGGISDNIGLRALLHSTDRGDSLGLYANVNLSRTRRIAVVVVDAKPRGEPEADRSATAPGLTTVLEAAATRPMENYSSESVERLRSWFNEWDRAASDFDAVRGVCDRRGPGAERCRREFSVTDEDRPPHPELYVIHVRFDAIPEEHAEVRRRLEKVPTTLQLPKGDVDQLVAWAKWLLGQSTEYRRLVNDLRGDMETAAREEERSP